MQQEFCTEFSKTKAIETHLIYPVCPKCSNLIFSTSYSHLENDRCIFSGTCPNCGEKVYLKQNYPIVQYSFDVNSGVLCDENGNVITRDKG